MSSVETARSYLFVPGNRADRFEKAIAAGADEVLIDLEDAVAAADKTTARAAVVEWLRENPAMVRVNSADTEWHADDLDALRESPGLRGVVLPKARDVDEVRDCLVRLGQSVPLLALIETAKGVRDAAAIAELPGVVRLVFGNLDFALDAGITVSSKDETELHYARSALVVASRAARLPGPVDGVYPELDNDEGLLAATARGRDLGLPAKLCLHPRQLPVVHRALRPGEDELAWARRVLDAAADLNGAAVRVDGQMIDAPRLTLARQLLERA